MASAAPSAALEADLASMRWWLASWAVLLLLLQHRKHMTTYCKSNLCHRARDRLAYICQGGRRQQQLAFLELSFFRALHVKRLRADTRRPDAVPQPGLLAPGRGHEACDNSASPASPPCETGLRPGASPFAPLTVA